MKQTCGITALILAATAVSQAATITLLNKNFDTGVFGGSATNWTDINGGGANSTPSNYWANNTPNLAAFGGVMHLKSDGSNYIQQAFNASDLGAVNATTFNSYTVGFDYGYRRDSTTSGDHTIRISLWDVTDNVEITGTTLTITDPGVGSNSLTNGSFILNYDNTLGLLTGDAIAIRFTSTSSDLGSNAWQRTAMIDNVTLTAVPEPAAALLGGLGVFALLRRRRA